jgi:hypothetical protein
MIAEAEADVEQEVASLLEATRAEVAGALSVVRMDTSPESALMLANVVAQEVTRYKDVQE